MRWRLGYVKGNISPFAHVARDGDVRTPCGGTLHTQLDSAFIACQTCRATVGDSRTLFETLVNPEGVVHRAIPVLLAFTDRTPLVERVMSMRLKGCSPHFEDSVPAEPSDAASGAAINCLACLALERESE